MRILEIKVMRGPNFWSNYRHKLIVMKLDLEELEEKPTNKIEGFSEKLEKLIPSLYKHRCSEEGPGGFFFRVKEGTWMGHVVEHVALELQTLAGMECGYGRTRSAGEPGVYNVVYSYQEENAGIYAGKAAIRIIESIINNEDYDFSSDITKLRRIKEKEALGPSTASIVEEAESRKIPYLRLDNNSLVMLGHGVNQRRIRSTIVDTTGSIAVDIACDKEETKSLLKAAAIPVPVGEIIYYEDELPEVIKAIGFPLVLKPINGNHGRGISINIQNETAALEAFKYAQTISQGVIVEKFVTGFDFRFLVVNYKLVAIAKRTPAFVSGDGNSTIEELINILNSDERRGDGHEKELTRVVIDKVTLDILKEKNLLLSSILPDGEILYLKNTANISTGGIATDVTDIVHPYNILLAERVARIVGLDICGIDIMTSCVSIPIVENGGVVLEVNAAPGFRMHLKPTIGLPRNVAAPVVDMLFPKGVPSTIPIVAVTGTNGKTTTSRLIAHLMGSEGYRVGLSTTDGVYIQNQLVKKGDCTGPLSAQFVLKDPTVSFAVLECARGGILRSGLGFKHCDIGIVTNVAEDHIGLDGIDSITDMARVKAIVPQSVIETGYAILNADDELVYDMSRDIDCKIALFATSESNRFIKYHCEDGGLAAILENGYITICQGNWKTRVDEVVNIPLTHGGKADFMIQNILPAVLTAYIKNVRIEDIRKSLRTFLPSPEQTPGRMNLFKFLTFDVLIDYAHNAHGYNALKTYLDKIQGKHKVGIIGAVGDRRDKDLIELGRIAANMFDEIIVRQDKDLRGRSREEIESLVLKGINEVSAKEVMMIPRELEALEYVLKNVKENSFITICSDNINEVISIVSKYKENETRNEMAKESFIWNMEKPKVIKY